MLTLPPVAPQVGWSTTVRLPRDHYVRLDSNDYSVDPVAVGRKVVVTADLEKVSVHLDGRSVGAHQRCWTRQQTITDPAHRAAALAMSSAAAHRPPQPGVEEVEQRDLGTYDQVFGLTEVMA